MLSPNGKDDRHGEVTAADRDADLEALSALRDVLVGPERESLAALQARLDDREARARDVGEVLPTVLLQRAQDPHFARALTPPLEKALTAAVRRDPKPMADALFPVMGPAIRKAVSAALAGMVESFNRAIEDSLSWRSVQWRLEARRTGRSFGEVVLLKTLIYRVEQVFLIDRRTGLLLQHVQHGTEQVQDADMVSGMLTAIRDFAQDSFKTAEADSLESLQVGDLSVWIEAGPLAIVAAVIRGTAPREYRQTLQSAVEEIHLRFGEALQSFTGDATPFEDARSLLESCLELQYRASERKPRTWGAWVLVAAVVLALAVWTALVYRSAAALGALPGCASRPTWHRRRHHDARRRQVRGDGPARSARRRSAIVPRRGRPRRRGRSRGDGRRTSRSIRLSCWRARTRSSTRRSVKQSPPSSRARFCS